MERRKNKIGLRRNKLVITYERSLRLPLDQKISDVYFVKSIHRAHDIIHRGNRKVVAVRFVDADGKVYNQRDIEIYNYKRG